MRLISQRVLIAAALSSVLTVGCDSLYKIERSIPLQRLPAQATVEAALRELPQIDRLDCRQITPPNALRSHQPAFYQVYYATQRANGVVEVRETADGKKALNLYRGWINHRPRREEIAETRALMDQVYAALRKHIQELPFKEEVSEKLVGMKNE